MDQNLFIPFVQGQGHCMHREWNERIDEVDSVCGLRNTIIHDNLGESRGASDDDGDNRVWCRNVHKMRKGLRRGRWRESTSIFTKKIPSRHQVHMKVP
jgi:hypothetical protein